MSTFSEDMRAYQAITTAAQETEEVGEDIRSLASAMLVHASSFYAAVHGREGSDGLIAAMMQIAQVHAASAASEHDFRRYGPAGRA